MYYAEVFGAVEDERFGRLCRCHFDNIWYRSRRYEIKIKYARAAGFISVCDDWEESKSTEHTGQYSEYILAQYPKAVGNLFPRDEIWAISIVMNHKGPLLEYEEKGYYYSWRGNIYPTLSAIDKVSGIELRGGKSIADGMTYGHCTRSTVWGSHVGPRTRDR